MPKPSRFQTVAPFLMLPALLASLLSGIAIAAWRVTHASGHGSSDRLAQIGDWLGLAVLVLVFVGSLLAFITLLAARRVRKSTNSDDHSLSP